MLTSAEEVTAWLKTQEEAVLLIGAYLTPLREYVARCDADEPFTSDIGRVHELHALMRDFTKTGIYQGLDSIGLKGYYDRLLNSHFALIRNITAQTIPSERRDVKTFVSLMRSTADNMAEVMMAVAKAVPPPFSITLAAGTPFDAYLLISRLVENATDFIRIVDAYADASLFSRYLFRVKDGAQVSVRTSPSKWNKKGWKAQFEEAEALFSTQHHEYDRQDRDDLHARYLITETGGWRIDGSIKDIAVSKDCPMHTVTPEEREKVIADYFTAGTP